MFGRHYCSLYYINVMGRRSFLSYYHLELCVLLHICMILMVILEESLLFCSNCYGVYGVCFYFVHLDMRGPTDQVSIEGISSLPPDV
jgi:hypothetical protein